MKTLLRLLCLLLSGCPLYAQQWIETSGFNRVLAINDKGLYGYTENVWGQDISKSKVLIPFSFSRAEVFNKDGHAVVVLNGKTGMIDTLGHFVIPAEYDEVFAFNHGYAVVYKDGKFGAVNAQGKLVVPLLYDYITPFKAGGRTDAVKGNKWGVIDGQHKEHLPFEYHYIRTDEKNYSFTLLKEMRFMDPSGKPVLDNTYQTLSHHPNGIIEAFQFSGNTVLLNSTYDKILPADLKFKYINAQGTHVIVSKDGKYGLYDLAAKKLSIPVEFESIDFNGELVTVERSYANGPAWFADVNGKILGGKQYTKIRSFSTYSNLAMVSNRGKWGLIDRKGNEILPVEMGTEDEPEINIDINTGRISAKKGAAWGMTDLNGKIILPFQYTTPLRGSANPFYFIGDSKINIVRDIKTGNNGVINEKGQWIITPGSSGYDELDALCKDVEGGGIYIPVRKNNKWGIYDLSAKKEITAPQFPRFGSIEFAHSSYLDAKDKWGLVVYSTGKVFRPNQYEYTDYDEETGLVMVEKNNLKGLMDMNENIIVPVEYDALSYDSEVQGYFAVKKGKAGFIDPKGKTIIPFKYEPMPGNYPNNWWNGHVRMLQQGKSVMVNRNGKVVASASDFRGPSDMFIVRTRYSGTTFCFMGKHDDEDGREVMNILLNGKLYSNLGGDILNPGSGSVIVFNEGLIAAKRNGLFGYLDQNGNEAIPFTFERAGPFSNGIAYVKKDGKFFIINREGTKLPHIDMTLAMLTRFNK